MAQKQVLGLIGGLGVGATIHYYRDLAASSRDCSVPLNLLIAHADLASVFAFVQQNDHRGLAACLAQFLHSLKDAGATVAAISAITPHCALDQLGALSPLPILDVFAPVQQAIAARGIQRVAIFGTRFVMASQLFGRLPQLQFVAPEPEETAIIHDIYVELTVRAEASPRHLRVLTDIAQNLVRRHSVDAILLAGTELSMVFNESNTDFPAVDCAAIHLAAIKRALAIDNPQQAGERS